MRNIYPDSSCLAKENTKRVKKLQGGIATPSLEKSLKVPQAKGCKNCNATGYRGRIGIFESFLVEEEMEKFILTSPSISSLRKKLIQKGMITIHQDGLLKVLQGITTIEEIERVTGE